MYAERSPFITYISSRLCFRIRTHDSFLKSFFFFFISRRFCVFTVRLTRVHRQIMCRTAYFLPPDLADDGLGVTFLFLSNPMSCVYRTYIICTHFIHVITINIIALRYRSISNRRCVCVCARTRAYQLHGFRSNFISKIIHCKTVHRLF